jgi:predicted glycosyltransferase
MSDQGFRAALFERRGLARRIDPEAMTAQALAETILESLAGPRPAHDIDLGGAECTRRILDEL